MTTSTWARRLAVIVVLAALPLATAGCGVDEEASAHRISRQAVPPELLEPATTTTTTTTPPAVTVTTAPLQSVTLYYVRADRIVRVQREVDTTLATLGLLTLLSTAPAASDAATGMRTALPPKAVTSVSVSGGIAAVDLATPFTEGSARDQTFAFAQITYTLTALPGVGLVSFTLNGAHVDVPGGDGSIVLGPVSRDTYRGLVSA
jgi:spore germination protein GerM